MLRVYLKDGSCVDTDFRDPKVFYTEWVNDDRGLTVTFFQALLHDRTFEILVSIESVDIERTMEEAKVAEFIIASMHKNADVS